MLSFFQLLEAVTEQEIINIAKKIYELIPHKYANIYVIQDVLDSPKVVNADPSSGSMAPSGFKHSSIRELQHNFRLVFGTEGVKDAEIIFIQYNNSGVYIFIPLVEYHDGRKNFHISFSYHFAHTGIIKKIYSALEENGYTLFHQKDKQGMDASMEFLEGLIYIFRKSSGRTYSSSEWPAMEAQYKKLISEFPEEYAKFNKRKEKILGDSVFAKRQMTLSSNMPVVLSSKKEVTINEAATNELEFYYPLMHPFSQWEESLPKEENLHTAYCGGYGPESYKLFSYIPVKAIIYSARIIPAGFSFRVAENEILVYHGKSKGFDERIKCIAKC